MSGLGRNTIILLVLVALLPLAGPRLSAEASTKADLSAEASAKADIVAAAESALGERQPPQGPARSWGNSVGHGYSSEAQLTGPAGPQSPPPDGTRCTAQQVAGLRPAALIRFLRTQSFQCLRFLWSYNEAVASVLHDSHMRAAYRAIAATARKKSAAASEHLHKLLFFVRIGHYHSFYQHFTFGESVQQAAIKAFDALRPQVNRALVQSVPGPWLHEWVNALDGAQLAHRYLGEVKRFLRAFMFEPKKLENAKQQRNAYSALTVISRHIGNRSKPFLKVVDADLISLLTGLALKAELLDKADYVLNAAVWALGRIGPMEQHEAAVVKALHQITQSYGPTPEAPSYRAPYLWVLQALDKYLRCPIGDIQTCKNDLSGELESTLFPKRYSFDDGAMVFETSLSLEEVQPLYHAAKEVYGQFSRVTGALAPVKRDPNCILRIKLYGSKEAFSNYHWFLYDLPTNNGGIYIEPHGVFYTFQRTKSQSRYSLEELFRHEYVHYLVGRYLIDGFWGRVPLYQQGRMVWFDEGFAEFLTWSSSETGVRIRRSLVAQVAGDQERMGIREIMKSGYGNFKFYRYAGLLFNFLYQNEPATLRNLLTTIRASDASGLDQFIARLSDDRKIERAYQRFLDAKVAEQNGLDDPQTYFPDVALLDLDDAVSIETEFKRTSHSGHAQCNVAAHTVNRRFACRDKLVGDVMSSRDYEAAWQNFDRRLNETVSALRVSGRPNNFQAMNCHMGPIRFRPSRNQQFYPVAAIYCEGPLAPRPVLPVDPVVQLVRDFQRSVPGPATECAVAPDGRIECAVTVRTSVYDKRVADQVLNQEIALLVNEVASQVYATRPSFYGSLACSEVGTRESVEVDKQHRYQKTQVSCVVELCPCSAVSFAPQSLEIL